MVTIKNRAAYRAALVLLLVTGLALGGCQPSAPRALRKGEQALRQGRYGEAVRHFETAARLLPHSAPAWNHLGLAYHGHGQLEAAQRAYLKALALDHKLAAAHFNLGCLYLDQNLLTNAVAELTTFTALEGASVAGWLKLATAQSRAGRLDAAEKSYRMVLELHPRHPEALNGLGLVKHQRRRPQEALECFNAALAQQPDYAPALLNAAIVLHQTLHQRAQALDKYRQYLALNPRPAQWENVAATVRQLEAELAAAAAAARPPQPTASLVATQSPPAATTAAAQAMSSGSRPTQARDSGPPPTSRSTASPTTAGASTPAPASRTTSPATATSAPVRPATPLVTMAAPPAAGVTALSSNAPKAETHPPAPGATNAPRAPDLIVSRVAEELKMPPPTEIAAPPLPPDEPAGAGLTAPPSTPAAQAARPPRRTFLNRINPFRSRAGAPPDSVAASPAAGASAPALPEPSAASVDSMVLPPPPAATGPRVIARYDYLTPAKPAPGDRGLAEKLVREGVAAHQAGKLTQALAHYRAAARADPSSFEAHYNEGLAAYELGQIKASLQAYEYALALQPDSVDARYHFALALKRGNYLLDAAAQLERLLRDHPNEVRAHYSLATLYAHQLQAPDRAQPHFQKVLELQPRHPDAGQIRFWLAQRR